MNRRMLCVIGLVVCILVGIAATVFLFRLGLRPDALTAEVAPIDTLVGAGGMLVGVVGTALFLGLVLRPDEPAREVRAPNQMPDA
ncbi:MAG: hypothetical protein ABWY68_12120 [Cryobacterium sp.]